MNRFSALVHPSGALRTVRSDASLITKPLGLPLLNRNPPQPWMETKTERAIQSLANRRFSSSPMIGRSVLNGISPLPSAHSSSSRAFGSSWRRNFVSSSSAREDQDTHDSSNRRFRKRMKFLFSGIAGLGVLHTIASHVQERHLGSRDPPSSSSADASRPQAAQRWMLLSPMESEEELAKFVEEELRLIEEHAEAIVEEMFQSGKRLVERYHLSKKAEEAAATLEHELAAIVQELEGTLLDVAEQTLDRLQNAVSSATAGNPGSDDRDVSKSSEEADLPVYTREEIRAHRTPETGVWVTVGEYVYDVTEFLEEHPGGGDKLILAAGGAVEPFWDLYTIHRHPDSAKLVAEYLDRMRIGRLDPEDAKREAEVQREGPYANEPERLPALIPLQEEPFNAESPPEIVYAKSLSIELPPPSAAEGSGSGEEEESFVLEDYVDENDFLTPTALWYVRHHHPVPVVDPETYRLKVYGAELLKDGTEQDRPRHTRTGAALPRPTQEGPVVEFTLEELKTDFPKQEIISTMQCAGNRRKELHEYAKTQGLHWRVMAISTAKFGGVWLRDVLAKVGVDGNTELRHVHTEGLDQPYGASIPMEKAISPTGDVMLAYEMNGEPLPRDHGYPLRLIVPGHVGARQVKWVHEIRVSDEEQGSTWQRSFPYKGLSPSVKSFSGIDPMTIPSAQELPVQSAMTNIRDGHVVEIEDLELDDEADVERVAGWAWSGGGRGIARVEVTPDDGKNWYQARLHQLPQQQWNRAFNRAWCWTLWEVDIPHSVLVKNSRFQSTSVTERSQAEEEGKKEGEVELACRAVDVSYNVQPERAELLWNARGILNNSWHRVRVKTVLPELPEDAQVPAWEANPEDLETATH